MTKEPDEQGYTTKVTHLGKGKYGCRLLKGTVVIAEKTAKSKSEISSTLKEMLRMADKCGFDSDMCSASRERNFCSPKKRDRNV